MQPHVFAVRRQIKEKTMTPDTLQDPYHQANENQELKSINYEMFILALSVLSLVNLVLDLFIQESALIQITILADKVLSLIFLAISSRNWAGLICWAVCPFRAFAFCGWRELFAPSALCVNTA